MGKIIYITDDGQEHSPKSEAILHRDTQVYIAWEVQNRGHRYADTRNIKFACILVMVFSALLVTYTLVTGGSV